MLLIKGYKYPLIIPTLIEINHPSKLVTLMVLIQKENLQCYS